MHKQREAQNCHLVVMRLLLTIFALAVFGTQAIEWAKVKPIYKTRPTLTAPKISNKIIGGDYAFLGQFPNQVALYLDAAYFCGGSLISDNIVLTAAHCAEDIRTFEVHAGTTWNQGGQVVTSRNATIHEYYDSVTIINDLALVFLPNQLTGENIGPVRLPSHSMLGVTFAGQYARVSGWGRTSDSSPYISEDLKFVDVKVIENAECAAVYGDIINDSKICVDTNAGLSGTCNGDSGGPLIIFEADGDATQIGVVSFGASDGCEAGYPDGLTRITEYLTWIETNAGITIRP
ncbi:brachyurin-like [Neocloeon triangulifer]|uniref:brachyurin-like n=1 Tax=Neocloeon triangulifer TaxID=2078957 RepID=UPI00286EB5D9|nr:brachyurin-like [Neocloeon triangulifer]